MVLEILCMADDRQVRNGKNRNKELKRLNIFLLDRMEMNIYNTLAMGEKLKVKNDEKINLQWFKSRLSFRRYTIFCVILELNLALSYLICMCDMLVALCSGDIKLSG